MKAPSWNLAALRALAEAPGGSATTLAVQHALGTPRIVPLTEALHRLAALGHALRTGPGRFEITPAGRAWLAGKDAEAA